jgi:hypothetical protein
MPGAAARKRYHARWWENRKDIPFQTIYVPRSMAEQWDPEPVCLSWNRQWYVIVGQGDYYQTSVDGREFLPVRVKLPETAEERAAVMAEYRNAERHMRGNGFTPGYIVQKIGPPPA